MSLRLTDEYDPDDWDVYRGMGPMRTAIHYCCRRCDKVRCHLVVEVADDGTDIPKEMIYDREVRMPCPLNDGAVFEADDDPAEIGWDRMGEKDD